ncbi:uncharacterized protein BHQ10_007844 [Talaromyces amestolkiae]|uniref:N-acetyltransferase domain-containing protein n=1 Tax=Talaromyces amestolkiae TaxID=1196081 RepID=A0A364L7R0_TALAM|nr:uncharacterized protein BHQ10_007844 [Talaromyces amestolkiae]RAO71832.1 hypothetical protein BHQ10_007844 [Talaromyces amestolkiae]
MLGPTSPQNSSAARPHELWPTTFCIGTAPIGRSYKSNAIQVQHAHPLPLRLSDTCPMDGNADFVFFRISKTNDVASSVFKYRQLRLEALKVSPASFASTYEAEAAFTDEYWVKLLTSPGRETFICAAIPRPDNVHQFSNGTSKWVGQVSILASSSSDPSSNNIDPGNDNERWQMLSLFTFPEYRGKGLGKKLCHEVLDFIRDFKDQPKVAELSLVVKAHNTAAVRLYERLGFAIVRRCTLVEALTANGDSHLLPADRSASKYTDLSGLIMKSTVLRS